MHLVVLSLILLGAQQRMRFVVMNHILGDEDFCTCAAIKLASIFGFESILIHFKQFFLNSNIIGFNV